MTGTSCPAKGAGTVTAFRSRSRWRRRSAPKASATSRRSASPSSTLGAARPSGATSASSNDSPNGSASGSTCRGLLDDGRAATSSRVWWSLKSSARTRPARRGPTGSRRTARGAALRCPTHEVAQGYRDGRGPEPVPAVPDHRGRRPDSLVGVSLVLDHDAVDAALEHGARGRSRRPRMRRGARRRALHRREPLVESRCSARMDRATGARATLSSVRATSRPTPTSKVPTSSCRRLRLDGGRDRRRASRTRVRRPTTSQRAARRVAGVQAGRRRRADSPTSPRSSCADCS